MPDEADYQEQATSSGKSVLFVELSSAAMTALLDGSLAEPSVNTVRATISPGNVGSLATISGFGFAEVGEQWDEEDGRELIFEVAARTSPC